VLRQRCREGPARLQAPGKGDLAVSRLRVLVADDHAATLREVAGLLEPSFDVVACVSNGRTLVEAAGALLPDVIVSDITMPELDGITAARQILRFAPCAKVLFLTVHSSPQLVEAGLAAGASGYVLKSSAVEDLVTAIQQVSAGERFISFIPSLGQGPVRSNPQQW